jgi:hypothetical protein
MDVSFFIFVHLAKPIYRPFRASAFLNRYLGLKPQAESYCPFGAETDQSPIRRTRCLLRAGVSLLIKTQRDQKVDCVLQALILQLRFGDLAGFQLFISVEFRISAVDQSRFI